MWCWSGKFYCNVYAILSLWLLQPSQINFTYKLLPSHVASLVFTKSSRQSVMDIYYMLYFSYTDKIFEKSFHSNIIICFFCLDFFEEYELDPNSKHLSQADFVYKFNYIWVKWCAYLTYGMHQIPHDKDKNRCQYAMLLFVWICNVHTINQSQS